MTNEIFSSVGETYRAGHLTSSVKPKEFIQDRKLFLPSSVFYPFPSYVQELLIKGGVSSQPLRLSPYHCVLTRHPVHRDSTESDVRNLVESIRANGYQEAYAIQAPLVAVKYSKVQVFPTRSMDGLEATVYDSWSDHPLFYAIGGAGRGEAIAKFYQNQELFRFTKQSIAESSSLDQTGDMKEKKNFSLGQTKDPERSSINFSEFSDKTVLPLTTQADASSCVTPRAEDESSLEKSDTVTGLCQDAESVTVQDADTLLDQELHSLGFYILTAGENLTGWELFLLSIALNTADPNSRPLNFFERTDQIVFICFELSKRKKCNATYRDIAIEICTNPFLSELEQHLQLDAEKIVILQDFTNSNLSREVKEQLIQSRSIFHWLPPNMGVFPQNVPQQYLEVLDVMIDMATCVNATRMKYSETLLAQRHLNTNDTEGLKKTQSQEHTNHGKAEGFLHSVAEDQLRYLFTHIIPVESASVFQVLVIRDLVSAVFGAIQECSFLFKQVVGLHRSTEVKSLATCPASSAYWIERIVFETSPGGLLAGLWNFPAAALIILFYIYFVNLIQTFDKKDVEANLLNVGTVLYRCIAELALTIRASKISLMTAPVPVQLRVLEGAAILFRLALFGVVHVECLPPHPYEIAVEKLNCSSTYFKTSCDKHTTMNTATSTHDEKRFPIRTFSDFDSCYDFLYTHWFKNLIHSRLPPTQDYRLNCHSINASSSSCMSSHRDIQNSSPPASSQSDDPLHSLALSTGLLRNSNLDLAVAPQSTQRKRPWYEARRIEVAATANRLRQEIESIVSQRNSLGPGDKINERIHVRRTTENVDPHHITISSHERPFNIIEVEILDPSVLPMANSAKLEFLSLVESVVTMLLERHGTWENHQDAANNSAPKLQLLSVPANMVVLAAIKVALTFISPHFDRLAPHLVHWISVRCRLILWIWRECRCEVIKRAEERWEELWIKHHPKGPPPQRLKIRFTSIQCGYGYYVDLTPAKLAKVVLGVLPGVLQSMMEFYEQREDESDDIVTREFFARWLKATGENDLVAQVNALLTQPSPAEKIDYNPRSHDLFPTSLSETSNIRTANTSIERQMLNTAESYKASKGIVVSSPPSGLSDTGNTSTWNNPPSLLSQRQPPQYLAQVPTFLQRESSQGKKNKKNSTLASKHHSNNEGVDDFLNWLDSLSYTERLRLDGQEVPQWELPNIANVPPPDLLLWKCPEALNTFTGNGLKATPYDRREWQRFYMAEFKTPSKKTIHAACDPYVYPLSDLDWKITAGVLKLLISRGIDTLASRHRGKVFFLDHCTSYTKMMEQLGAAPGKYQESERDYPFDSKGLQTDYGKKRGIPIASTGNKRRKTQNATVAIQKRYGPAFSKTNDLFTVTSQEQLNDHIADLHAIRLFLEHDLFH